MKIIIINNKIAFTAIDSYVPNNNEIAITKPDWVDHTQLEKYEYVNGEIREIIQPNWTGFNILMLQDLRFEEVLNIARSIAPLVVESLPAALTQVADKGTESFSTIFNQICLLGEATYADRTVWAGFAIDNNLPQEFINVMQGPEPEPQD